jgi:hypothetical protein
MSYAAAVITPVTLCHRVTRVTPVTFFLHLTPRNGIIATELDRATAPAAMNSQR